MPRPLSSSHAASRTSRCGVRRLLVMAVAGVVSAIAAADQPFLLTAEPGAHAIRRFSLDGTWQNNLATGSGAFTPNHFCVGPDRERLFVPTYAGTRNVQIFDVDTGAFLGIIDHPAFVSPAWVGLAPNDDLIIADFDGARVYRYDLKSNTFLGELVAPGHLFTAHSVVFNDDGSILVLDWWGGRIVRYDADGAFDQVLQDGPALLGPLDMRPSPDGTELYVTNAGADNLVIFDRATGDYRGELVTAASGLIQNSEGFIDGPGGTLLVTSPGSARVQRFDAETGDFLGTLFTSNGYPVDVLIVPAACGADVGNDGTVGIADLLALLDAWGTCSLCPADIDLDGSVGVADLLTVLGDWGACD